MATRTSKSKRKAPERLTSGPHFADFCRTYCRHTMQVPDGPRIGSPFELEDYQRLFWDEALELDPDTGRRIYGKAGLIIPRKNGKTTQVSAFALYTAGPWDGEYRPLVVLAAGSRDQAKELFDQASAFVDDPVAGGRLLRTMFVPRAISIVCSQTRGSIRRVAGDGKLNHGMNPHVVAADELHAWKTPKQRENWKALTTAQGAREDPMVVFLTSEGEDEDDELYDLMERIRNDPATEVEIVHRCFRIYRNREAGLLVHQYAAPAETPLTDLDTIALANPASWRTSERIARDLADPLVDELTKRRLYLGQRTAGMGRWISDAKIEEALTEREIPERRIVAIGVDAAKTRDCTAVGWAWIDPGTGECLTDCHVWSCVPGVPCHTFVEGGRLDNDDARDFIRDVLLKRFEGRLVFYDPLYFNEQAKDLAQDGFTCVEMNQSGDETKAAWNEFYADLHEGPRPKTLIPAGPRGSVLRSHIKAAKGKRSSDGTYWIVRKDDAKMDGLSAIVWARYGGRHFEDFMPRKPARLVSW